MDHQEASNPLDLVELGQSPNTILYHRHVHLDFDNLSCRYLHRLGSAERVTLQGVSGAINSGCVTVIMVSPSTPP